ncbi:MAG: ECF transporter S component [Nocardioides sp.]|jgi:energy-coupling factor transport system substrate-specific component
MSSRQQQSIDELVEALQEMRASRNYPSYADIAAEVGRIRVGRGTPSERARVARTTVYDAFRTGRRRLDSTLVADIVRALGGSETEAEDWAKRCHRAVQQAPLALVAEVRESAPDPETSPAVVEVEPAEQVVVEMSTKAACAIALVCVLANLPGRVIIDFLSLPLYLDMIGTAFAAIALGPWWGAGVGLTTNLLGAAITGPVSIPFALVNVAGALAWGYGVRRWRLGRSIPRFFALNTLVALVCSVVAIPIIFLTSHGITNHHGVYEISQTLVHATHSMVMSVSISNLLTSLADKLVSGFVALAVIETMGARGRSRLPAAWLTEPDDPITRSLTSPHAHLPIHRAFDRR